MTTTKPNIKITVACMTDPNVPLGSQVYSNYQNHSVEKIMVMLATKEDSLDPAKYNFESSGGKPVRILGVQTSRQIDNAGIDIDALINNLPDCN